MDITILGSGTMLSSSDRNPAGYLVNLDNRFTLMDAGPGTLQQLKNLNFNPLDLQQIILTHFHLDHCADVLPLLMHRFLLDKSSNKSMTIIGPTDIQKWYEGQAAVQGKWLRDAEPKLVGLANEIITTRQINVQSHLSKHTETSLCYVLGDGDRSVFFSGDMGYQQELAKFAAGCHTGFLECSLFEDNPDLNHLSAKETGQLAQSAGFKRLVLTHIYPENDTADLKQRVGAYFDGEIIVAEDFLRIEV